MTGGAPHPPRDGTLTGWLRGREVPVLFVYAAMLAVCAFALSRPALLVNDGHIYMEMARSIRHGTLEIPNGLDIVDSPELWLRHTVKRGPHLFPKYPPFYGFLAALPYAWLGIRGLYLLNCLGLVFIVPGLFLLARRLMPRHRAFVASLFFPLVVPVLPYALMELPHLVSAALVVWATFSWDECLRAPSRDRAVRRGTVAGLLAGIAFGVRLQVVVLAAPLFVIGAARAWRARSSRDRAAMVAFGCAFAACVVAVGALNLVRFGSPNPVSYGVSDVSAGMPIDEEKAGYFLRPATFLTAGFPLALFVVAPRLRRAAHVWLLAAAGAVSIAAVPPLREQALRMIGAAASLLLNAMVAGAGWSTPYWTFGWMNKALLASTPFLVLGLYGAIVSCARPAPRLPLALGWMAVATIVFISLRDPDPRVGQGSMTFLSLNPRYLVDVAPALYLLACRQLRGVRIRPAQWLTGACATAALLLFMWATGPDSQAPFKQRLIATGSIAGAAALLVAFYARRSPLGRGPLPLLVLVTGGYGAACTLAEDSRSLVTTARLYESWGKRVIDALPEHAAIVGWRFGKDAIFHLRAERPIVFVEPWADGGESLIATLDALDAQGITPFYFGPEGEKIVPRILGRYILVPVVPDPVLWRLQRVPR